MSCLSCQHDDHGVGPCPSCTAAGAGTCWQPVRIVGGDGDREAAGRIEMATGTEVNPCMICRSFEKDNRRLIQHFKAKGLTAAADGSFETPIAKDFAGRKSLKIFPDAWGFCRRNSYPVDMLATCPDFQQVRTNSELESRIKT
jgi:hypothetical protein